LIITFMFEPAKLQSGKVSGTAEVEAQLAAAAEAEAEADRLAALEEARERAANCGAPLFVDDYCPTDAEVALEAQAESLCGPGTLEGREQAAALAIQC
jgi:hypothetical protein